jgi:DNA-binding transcriptional ArsR family regulator
MEAVGPVLTALADPTRRAIFEGLRGRPRNVAELALDFQISRPAVSQHLKVLQEAGLLRSQRAGRQNFYALDLRGITLLRNYVEGFWDEVLGAFQAAAIEEAAQSVPGDKGRRRR